MLRSPTHPLWVNRAAEWVFYGACDPSWEGQGTAAIRSAIGVGGYNRETGVLDVVEAAIKSACPTGSSAM